ncbi:Phytoene desaturase [Penicillium diatomitis]|uniref:Phytoene desaturase n=1 Tax=Penicillium diatomitis TaxID=2819901 RepID=A0A9X0BSX4_9EURO|nr:Phytoene desaturase [Penicillium diatomitis]KAJ5483053.1 Phytoene desaturase [Penicillium diatomitis]
MEPTRKKVVVIGAGVGGIATAARLAQCGLDVSVYEKNDFVGGKCSSIVEDGHRFDRGPSLLLMTEVFEETYRHLGTSMSSEGVELLKCDPNCNFYFPDGQCLTTSTDLARMKRQLEKVDSRNGFQSFLSFLAESHHHYQQSIPHVLNKDFANYFALLRPGFLRYLFKLHPFHTVWQRVSHFFQPHQLRQVFSLASMYLGMSPFDTPGTYTLLQYTELTAGIWYPRGGFNRIAKTLADVGERLGVKYHLSQPVAGVSISSDKKALGIKLDTKQLVEADAVVVNADLLYAYEELLPSQKSTPDVTREKDDVSCSAITFYWSMSHQIHQLESHNMFVGQPTGDRFPDVYWNRDRKSMPSFYVHVPSRTDVSAAPEGKDTVMALVLVENIDMSGLAQHDLTSLITATREYVLSSMQSRIGVDLRDFIEHETLHSPTTWHQMFNSHRGSVFGLNHDFFNILSFRPHTKHDVIDGVYFVGASTHPGAGVPTCLSGAKITAERILRDLDVPIAWESVGTRSREAVTAEASKDTGVEPLRAAWKQIALLSVVFAMVAVWRT